jgi:hypothetical protein
MKEARSARAFDPDIPLQMRGVFRTLRPMRALVFIAVASCFAAPVARAQVQERKLMERVLKPDMTLENSAQQKQFTLSGGSAPTKSVRPKMFQFLQRSHPKDYAGVRPFQTKDFRAGNSPEQDRQANLATRNVLNEKGKTYRTRNYPDVRDASDMTKSVSSAQFSDSDRPFLVRGKSQKALSAQDRPLTIDEVRELLNKNK